MTENLNHNNEITPLFQSSETTTSGLNYSHQTILTGKALEDKHEEAVKIEGILSAPADFLERKQVNWQPENCHVRVDHYYGSITLYTDERTFNHNVIKGELNQSKVLAKFGINTGKQYSNFELATLLRTNKYWFATPEDHSRIIEQLNKFKAAISTRIESNKDNNGASLQVLEREVNGITWDRNFRLNIPVFEGYERVVVPVEIGVIPTSSEVKLFLESNDLYEIIEKSKDGLIKDQTDRFDAWGCSVVRVS